MCKGFVRLPRRLFETKWWNQKRIYSESDAIIDIYQSAGKSNTFSTSVRALADRWLWENTKVLRFLTKLTKEGYIITKKTTTGTTIEIVDFGTSATPNATLSATPSATPKSQSTKDFSGTDATPSATPSATLSATPSRAYKNDNIISCLNNKNIKKPPLSPKGENEYDWSALPDDMIQIAKEWIIYKREKKQTYKPTGFKTFCKKLINLSGGDAEKARRIVENSMANNYSGIFDLRGYENNRTAYQDKPTSPTDGEIQQFAEGVIMRHAAERRARQEKIRYGGDIFTESQP